MLKIIFTQLPTAAAASTVYILPHNKCEWAINNSFVGENNSQFVDDDNDNMKCGFEWIQIVQLSYLILLQLRLRNDKEEIKFYFILIGRKYYQCEKNLKN